MGWLKNERARPTAQRLKEYLSEKEYAHSSYKKIGKEIVLFNNWFAEKEDWVELIPPVGAKKKKERLVMPRDMVEALMVHVEERA